METVALRYIQTETKAYLECFIFLYGKVELGVFHPN